jgi:pyrroline-5-carboxylate reductase
MRYGFIGTGSITRAIVTGLSDRVTEPPEVILSPRNAATAAALASRFDNVTVGASNAEVVERADVAVLAVRPQDASVALSGLPFRPEQPVVSVMAGIDLEQLTRLVAPATRIARAIPLPEVARRGSLIPIFPFERSAMDLFERVGSVVVPPTELAFDAHSAVTAVVAGHFDYLGAIGDWFARQGVPPADARRYVAAIFRQVSRELDGEVPFSELADAHATAGGLNEQVRRDLAAAGVLRSVQQALTDVLARVIARPGFD